MYGLEPDTTVLLPASYCTDWLQMTSAVQDNVACIQDIFAYFLFIFSMGERVKTEQRAQPYRIS